MHGFFAMVSLVDFSICGDRSKGRKSLKVKGVGRFLRFVGVWWWLRGRGVGVLEG